jgi:hypothetical protein
MTDREQVRTMVRGAYDLQKLRIQMGNRIVANFKAQLGQKPGEKETTLDAEGQNLLKELRARYRKLTDGVKTFPRQATFKGDEVISSYTELCLLAQYVSLETAESQHFHRLGLILGEFAIYREFLEKVKGIGPAMAGVLISEIDIAKARYASSLWRYAGLDVARDGFRRSKRAEHLIEVEFVNRDGQAAKRRSITFNPFLKTKLMGVLGPSFLRCASPYARLYADHKHRLESHAVFGTAHDGEAHPSGHGRICAGRRHLAALGVMIKVFLIDLYRVWREMEGLPIAAPYSEAKLGLQHQLSERGAGESEVRDEQAA